MKLLWGRILSVVNFLSAIFFFTIYNIYLFETCFNFN